MAANIEFKLNFMVVALISAIILVNAQGTCPPTQAIAEGSTSKIRCVIAGLQGLRSWQFQSYNQTFQDLDPIRFQAEPDGVLIKNAGGNDFLLRLQIKHPVTLSVLRNVIVSVVIYASPVVKVLTTVNDFNDDFAHITCVASGKPTPKIGWTFESDNGDTREFENVIQYLDQSTKDLWSTLRAEESGRYYCRAYNVYGSDIKITRADLKTKSTTLSPHTTILPETTTNEDKSTTKPTVRAREIITNINSEALGCVATGFPKPIITFYHGNQRIEANRTYFVHDQVSAYVEQSVHGIGLYTCYATNPYGSASDFIQVIQDNANNPNEQFPVQVVVIKPVVDVKSTDTVDCIATGNPLPKILWQHNFNEYVESRANVIEKGFVVRSTLPVNETTTGHYRCIAVNSESTSLTEVIVLPGPNEFYPATVRVSNVYVNKMVNSDLGCFALGNPRPNIYWTKNNETLKSTEEYYVDARQELASYISVAKNGPGNYICHGENIFNKGKSSVEIMVSNPDNSTYFSHYKVEKNDSLVNNSRIITLKVDDSSIAFKIQNMDGQTFRRDIYYLYYIGNNASESNETYTNKTVKTGYLTASYYEQIFNLQNLPNGSLVTMYFAEDWATIRDLNIDDLIEGKSVLLLPPAPEVSLKLATTDYVLLEWRLRSLATENIDNFEVIYEKLDKKGEELVPQKYSIKTSIPVQNGNSYKLYRQSTRNYHLVKVRAHNEAGYGGWSSLLLSPY